MNRKSRENVVVRNNSSVPDLANGLETVEVNYEGILPYDQGWEIYLRNKKYDTSVHHERREAIKFFIQDTNWYHDTKQDNRLYASLELGGESYRSMVLRTTGISCMSSRIAVKFADHLESTKDTAENRFGDVKVLGWFGMNLVMFGRKKMFSFMVIDDLVEDIILGGDFVFDLWNMCINTVSRKWSIEGSGWFSIDDYLIEAWIPGKEDKLKCKVNRGSRHASQRPMRLENYGKNQLKPKNSQESFDRAPLEIQPETLSDLELQEIEDDLRYAKLRFINTFRHLAIELQEKLFNVVFST